MKRPAFTPVQIGISEPAPPDGKSALHMVDAKGVEQMVNLSLEVRRNLVVGMLTGPPGDSAAHRGHPQLLIDARNFRLLEQHGETILEIEVTQDPTRVMLVRLPGLLAEALEQQLRDWSKPQTSNPH